MKLKKHAATGGEGGGSGGNGNGAIAARFQLDVDPEATKRKAGAGGVNRNAALCALLALLGAIALTGITLFLLVQDFKLNEAA